MKQKFTLICNIAYDVTPQSEKQSFFEKGVDMTSHTALPGVVHSWNRKLFIRNPHWFSMPNQHRLTIDTFCKQLPADLQSRLLNRADYLALYQNITRIPALRNPHVFLTKFIRRIRACPYSLWHEIPILLFPRVTTTIGIAVMRWENAWVLD